MNNISGGADINDLTSKNLGGALHLVTLGIHCPNLYQQRIALDVGAFGQIHYFHYINNLVEVLGDLFDLQVITRGCDRQTRQ